MAPASARKGRIMFKYEAIRPRYETSPEVEKIVEAVSVCYQCGTCSGSCPVAPAGALCCV